MIRQHQQLKQQTKILPHQIQLLQLFHLNTLELEHRIQQEMTDNPMLERQEEEYEPLKDELPRGDEDYRDWEEYGYDDIPDYRLEYNNYFTGESVPDKPVAATTSFRELARQQFRLTCSDEKRIPIADYIIDCLDENGFLTEGETDIVDDLSFRFGQALDNKIIHETIRAIRELEPGGLACCNTREYLLFQLKAMNARRPDVKAAIRMLEECYEEMMHRQLDKVMSHLGLDEDEFKIVLGLMSGLKLKPVTEGGSETLAPKQTVVPDFVVNWEDDHFIVQLYKERSSSLYISKDWVQQVENMQKSADHDKSAVQYVKNKLSAARWFIQAIQQRESTMLKIMQAIVKRQEAYFKEGDIRLLKPMILKNIAEEINMDISTISRVTCNKYAETHFGTILLKDLFTEGLVNKEGEVVSSKVIQHAIIEVIEQEDKKRPLTDQQLVAVLSQRGFTIARRTIAKYRDLLQIPVAQMRCLWA